MSTMESHAQRVNIYAGKKGDICQVIAATCKMCNQFWCKLHGTPLAWTQELCSQFGVGWLETLGSGPRTVASQRRDIRRPEAAVK